MALAVLAATAAPLAHGAPGDPDISFGSYGRAIYGQRWQAHAVDLQSDGKIVVAGEALNDSTTFLVLRLNPDGSLDPSFSDDGVQKVGFGAGRDAWARALDIDSSGRIVVAGAADIHEPVPRTDVAVARLLPSGALDPGFDGDGKAVIDLGRSSQADGVIVQPDGKITVAGFHRNEQDYEQDDVELYGTLLARYNADGSLDSQFGDGGIVRGHPFDHEVFENLALQPNGRIVTVGSCCFPTYIELRLRRFAPDGTEEPAFGQQVEAANILGVGNDLALLPDGRVLVAADARPPASPGSLNEYELAVARFLPSGALDSSFEGGGLRYVRNFDGRPGRGQGIGLDSSDRIAVAGTRADATAFVATRFQPSGALDTSFGDGGRVITQVNEPDVATDMAVQQDGKIVTVGWIQDNPTRLIVLRHLVAGSNPSGTSPPVDCPGQTDQSVRCFDSSLSAAQRCRSRDLPKKRRKYRLTMIGSKKDEVMTGTKGPDLIIGRGGDDRQFGNRGNDCVIGGPGDDWTKGDGGNDLLAGEGGADIVQGDGGGDTLVGGRGSDTVLCGAGRDRLMGRRGRDSISANC